MITEIYDLTPEQRKAHEAVYGGHNSFPPNWREVTTEEIATTCLVRIYTPRMTEFRQVGTLVAGSAPLMNVNLFFFHDGSGYAQNFDSQGKRIRYFMFTGACQHEMVETSRPAGNRSGEHTTKCTKCDYTSRYDTSD